MKVYGVDTLSGPAAPAWLSSQAIKPRKGCAGLVPSGFNPCRNGMCSTISQNAARSCCTPGRFRQRHGGAGALAAPGR